MTTILDIVRSVAGNDDDLANDLVSHLIVDAQVDDGDPSWIRDSVRRRAHAIRESRRRHRNHESAVPFDDYVDKNEQVTLHVDAATLSTPLDSLVEHELLRNIDAIPATLIQRRYIEMLPGRHPTARSKADIVAEYRSVWPSTAYSRLAVIDELIRQILD